MATAWFIVRLLAVTVGFAALHGYVWWRLCRDTTEKGSVWRPIGAVALGGLAMLGLLARSFSPSGAPMWVQQAVGWPGWIWFGVFMYLFGVLVVTEPIRWFLLRRKGSGEVREEARASRMARDEPGREPESRPGPRLDPDLNAESASAPHSGSDPEGDAVLGSGRDHDADLVSGLNPGSGSDPEAASDCLTPASSLHRGDLRADTPDPGIQTGPPTPDPDPADTPTQGLSRRLLVSRAIGLGATTAALATVGHGLYEGYRTPLLKPVTVPLPRLDRRFDGYRIAVVGDTHFSALRGRGYCERVVDQINRAQADLIAFVGDLASNEADQIRHETDPLANLQARDGAFFVAGNAEHYVGADEWYDRVAELGMIGLPNTRVELPGFDLAGINDLIVEQRHLQDETGPDFEAALGDRDPDRPVIFMAHQPSAIDRALDYGIDLQLSGHTHGGQMWPVHYLSLLRSGQLSGLETHEGTPVYVTNGAGTNGPPIRVGADSDITVMTLRAGT
jgi:predicted MPP superfamily phosphohydrolase